MKPLRWQTAVLPGIFTAMLVAEALGCGQNGSPNANGTGGGAGALGGAGGEAPGTGSLPGDAATSGVASGGATSTSNGGASDTGGRSTDLGGAGASGRRSGTGGRTSAVGGKDAGMADASAGGPDALARPDTPADRLNNQDGSPDGIPTPEDAPQYDASPDTADDAGIPVPAGYKLVWSDEFDVDGVPDPKNWNYETGFARNEELQWYQPDNATVKDGLLVIEGRKERVSNPNYRAGSTDWKTSRQYAEYTSTSMTTSNLQTWQYGRFEMRARIPTSAGMWPAWWTLGVSGEWPSSGEIDIMEYYKGNVLANVACGTSTRWQAKWDSSTKSVSSLGAGWSNNFHVWRMDWDDQKIDLYLDEVLLNTASLSSMLNADGTSPFKQKHYMLVNLAIGGVNGGDPSSTSFPQGYEIDWIRVFQKL